MDMIDTVVDFAKTTRAAVHDYMVQHGIEPKEATACLVCWLLLTIIAWMAWGLC